MKQWYIKWRRRQRYCLSCVLTKKSGVTCVYRKIVVLFQIFLDFYGSSQHEIPNLNWIRIGSDVDKGNRIIWVGIDFTASASYRQSYMQLYCAWWSMQNSSSIFFSACDRLLMTSLIKAKRKCRAQTYIF